MVLDFEKVEEFLAKKYNLSIIRCLLDGRGRGFNSILKDAGPMTPRILSARLSELEKEKFVQKNLVLGNKPKIEYRITPKGEKLKKAISELEKWGKEALG
ncbi:MAG: helix-turn-helix transcriptional regulator [archaeon]|nr:helix-turn-helix transcriptional regulator [archaeon]